MLPNPNFTLLFVTEGTDPPEVEASAERIVAGAADWADRYRAGTFDAVIVQFPIYGWTPAEVLQEMQGQTPVLVAHPGFGVADVVRLMKLGAYHFFGERVESTELGQQLEILAQARQSREIALLSTAVSAEPWRTMIVGRSRAIETICHIVRLVGPKKSTVLITGETGTGKEVIARSLHMASDRASMPFVALNCNALPESLLEAELFGHVKGAFTGAMNQRAGRFEQANRGTIFFDEIGDMPPDLQAKLLRVLQEREFQRIGSSETIRVDVRVVAATNVDLAERVAQGRFREDLYYRLNVIPIRTPALRERAGDIPLLVAHFLEKICRTENVPVKQLTIEAIDRLAAYAWPGNVRQLENAVEMALALSGDRQTLYPADFPLPSAVARGDVLSFPQVVSVPDEGLDFEATVSRIERSILQQALRITAGNKKQAAEILHLKRTTLSAKLRALEATA